jgi:hypothetical protein
MASAGGKAKKADEKMRVCSNCSVSRDRKEMKSCAQCRAASYCSKDCQREHWKLGGHKKECKPRTTEKNGGAPGGSGGATAGAGATKAKLMNPCPSCHAKEDDCPESGMCFACGQLYCDDCNPSKNAHCACTGKVDACVVCHAVARDEDGVHMLRRLLKRPVGRFTPHAECNLGACYAFGEGVPKDNAEAIPWFRRAAERGHAKAQCYMGTCFSRGASVDEDPALAAQVCMGMITRLHLLPSIRSV